MQKKRGHLTLPEERMVWVGEKRLERRGWGVLHSKGDAGWGQNIKTLESHAKNLGLQPVTKDVTKNS